MQSKNERARLAIQNSDTSRILTFLDEQESNLFEGLSQSDANELLINIAKIGPFYGCIIILSTIKACNDEHKLMLCNLLLQFLSKPDYGDKVDISVTCIKISKELNEEQKKILKDGLVELIAKDFTLIEKIKKALSEEGLTKEFSDYYLKQTQNADVCILM